MTKQHHDPLRNDLISRHDMLFQIGAIKEKIRSLESCRNYNEFNDILCSTINQLHLISTELWLKGSEPAELQYLVHLRNLKEHHKGIFDEAVVNNLSIHATTKNGVILVKGNRGVAINFNSLNIKSKIELEKIHFNYLLYYTHFSPLNSRFIVNIDFNRFRELSGDINKYMFNYKLVLNCFNFKYMNENTKKEYDIKKPKTHNEMTLLFKKLIKKIEVLYSK